MSGLASGRALENNPSPTLSLQKHLMLPMAESVARLNFRPMRILHQKPNKSSKEFAFDITEEEARKRVERAQQQTGEITRNAQLDPKDELDL